MWWIHMEVKGQLLDVFQPHQNKKGYDTEYKTDKQGGFEDELPICEQRRCGEGYQVVRVYVERYG